jgi:gamma-glutamylcyclotransferase (GGCT)/AIG2-like uncharacterized protein YtfP
MGCDLFVFYGTLMTGLPARPERPAFEEHMELVGLCRLRALLYDAGPFPCLVEGDGTVLGELWRAQDERAIELLDEWEEYQADKEANSLYLRRLVPLSQPAAPAWAYFWNGSQANLTLVPSGDWRSLSKAYDAEELSRLRSLVGKL